MKALVTGGTGFIGSHLIETLHQRGWKIRLLARSQESDRYIQDIPFERFEYPDFGDRKWISILDGVDTVFHIAGVESARSEKEFLACNEALTRKMIESVASFSVGIKRFLYVSSLTAAGPAPDAETPVHERMPLRPINAYGRSKLRSEEALLQYADRVPITIVRPASVYGPRDLAWVQLYKMVKKGFYPRVGRADRRLSVIHVQDLVDGLLEAAKTPLTAGKIYHLSNPEHYSEKDMAKLAGEFFGKKRLYPVFVPETAAMTFGTLAGFFDRGENRKVLFNRIRANEMKYPYWVSTPEQAMNDFQFSPKVKIDEGVMNVLHWYQKEGWL